MPVGNASELVLGEMRAWSLDLAADTLTWSGVPGRAPTRRPRVEVIAQVDVADRARLDDAFAAAAASRGVLALRVRVPTATGETSWIEVRGVYRGDPAPCLQGLAWDVTAQQRQEVRGRATTALDAALRGMARLFLRARTPLDVFRAACDEVVSVGGVRFAWIGLVDDAGTLRPVVERGAGGGYLEAMARDAPVTSGEGPLGRGPGGTALREGQVSITSDVATDARFAPWRQAALERGLRCNAAIPLRQDGRVIGTFGLYGDEPHAFQHEHPEVLLALADTIGQALERLASDQRREAAEQALRESEGRYRSLFEYANEAIMIASVDGISLDANAASYRLLGYPPGGLVGIPVARVLDPREPPRLLGQPSGTRSTYERRLVHADGSLIDVELSGAVMPDGRLIAFSRDIRERKAMQAQLVLADRLAALGRLAASVAHEINNPLAYVVLNLERIAAGLDDHGNAEVRDALAEVTTGVERVRVLVRALQAQGRGASPSDGVADVARTIDGAARMIRNRVEQHGALVVEHGATRPARASELELGQVVLNLLTNAADALAAGARPGQVTVRTVDVGDEVVIEVTDTGHGIAPADLARVFEPFFTTKPGDAGTGLGLAISRGIVDGVGGSIRVTSAVDVGTTFRVALPAVAASAVVEAPPPPATAAAAVARHRVLIIDDELPLARLFARALRGHEVTTLSSAAEALPGIRAGGYDCVVCDLMIPGFGGLDLHAALVADGQGHDRRLVFVTGGAFVAEAERLLGMVTQPVLLKPFPARVLADAVATLLATVSPAVGPR